MKNVLAVAVCLALATLVVAPTAASAETKEEKEKRERQVQQEKLRQQQSLRQQQEKQRSLELEKQKQVQQGKLHKDQEKQRSLELEKQKQVQQDKLHQDQEKQRSLELEKQKQVQQGKLHQDQEKQRSLELEKQKQGSQDKLHQDQEKQRSLELEKQKQVSQDKLHQDQEKQRSLELEKQKQVQQGKLHQDQEKQRSLELEKQKQVSQDKLHQDQERQRELEKQKVAQPHPQHPGEQLQPGTHPQTSEQLRLAQEQSKEKLRLRQETLNRPAYKLPEGQPVVHPGAKPEPLKPEGAHHVVTEVNAARANMHGINAKPLPQGNVTVHPDGALRVEASGGRHYAVRPNGSVSSYESTHHKATFMPDGRIATLHSGGLRISEGHSGGRYVYHERPDHVVVVSAGRHYGYVQRPVVIRNTTYIQRTYVVNNVSYTRVYVPYSYRGMVVYRYAPAVYYSPAYYGWAYRPWAAPVVFTWGWRADPWYGSYSYYFQPMREYPAPRYWLADYLLAEELREAYLVRESRPPPDYADYQEQPQAAAPITDEVREQIALEVQRQLEEDRLAASTYRQPEVQPAVPVEPASQPAAEIPPAIQQAGRVFVVSKPLDVMVGDQPCALSAGDVLRMDAAPQAGEPTATVRVLSSRGDDCPAGALALFSVSDLQEMYNNFHEKLDTGMVQLRSNPGGGMPPPPADAMATVQGPGAAAATPAENAAATLAETERKADQAQASLEQEMAAEAATTPN